MRNWDNSQNPKHSREGGRSEVAMKFTQVYNDLWDISDMYIKYI